MRGAQCTLHTAQCIALEVTIGRVRCCSMLNSPRNSACQKADAPQSGLLAAGKAGLPRMPMSSSWEQVFSASVPQVVALSDVVQHPKTLCRSSAELLSASGRAVVACVGAGRDPSSLEAWEREAPPRCEAANVGSRRLLVLLPANPEQCQLGVSLSIRPQRTRQASLNAGLARPPSAVLFMCPLQRA